MYSTCEGPLPRQVHFRSQSNLHLMMLGNLAKCFGIHTVCLPGILPTDGGNCNKKKVMMTTFIKTKLWNSRRQKNCQNRIKNRYKCMWFCVRIFYSNKHPKKKKYRHKLSNSFTTVESNRYKGLVLEKNENYPSPYLKKDIRGGDNCAPSPKHGIVPNI